MRGTMCWVLVGISVMVFGLLFGYGAWAVWVEDGTALCTATGTQQDPTIVSDGAGGAIVTWEDWRSGTDYDIYARRVDASGAVQWTANGVALCTATGDQQHPTIVSDGAGGAVIAWQDYRSGSWPAIYAQRVDASGAVQWVASGMPVCTAAGILNDPMIVSDGAGGAIVAWWDGRSGIDYDIYAQRVNASGTVQWATDGVALCDTTGNQQLPTIISDGMGGAIVTWWDQRSGTNWDIYAQRVDASGIVLWTADGESLCTATGDQSYPKIVSDGAGGAIVTWHDARGADCDIYAQRVDAFGAVQWTANGVALCTATGDQLYPTIVSDGAGAAVITWQDYRSGSWPAIYAQRVDASGAVQWVANGVPLCTAAGILNDPMIVSDGAGGAIVTWWDGRSGIDYDIYAQRVNASGAVQWATNGVALCTATGDQQYPTIVSDGAGGAVIAWQDYRSGTSCDIYAHFVDREGRVGYLPPKIDSARDVPGDEGGRVYLSWYASPVDICQDAQMSHYTIWRAIDAARASIMLENGAALLTSGTAIAPQTSTPVVRTEQLAGETYFWELVDTHDAYYLQGYGKSVATLFDSTSVCDEYHYFQVIAHTSDPRVFWVSDPDSGYSVDNLSPSPPAALAAEFIGDFQLHIHWNPNTEVDLSHYAIYRGTSDDFVPDETNRIGTATDSCFVDEDFGYGEYYYKVSAWDTHENESPFSLLTPDMISGTRDVGRDYANVLFQNAPNPFVSSTRIAFSIKEAGHVRLSVFDARGRLVRVLADEVRGSGRYVEEWDGRDASGRPVGSGTYFYRLEVPGWTAVKKMTYAR